MSSSSSCRRGCQSLDLFRHLREDGGQKGIYHFLVVKKTKKGKTPCGSSCPNNKEQGTRNKAYGDANYANDSNGGSDNERSGGIFFWYLFGSKIASANRVRELILKYRPPPPHGKDYQEGVRSHPHSEESYRSRPRSERGGRGSECIRQARVC